MSSRKKNRITTFSWFDGQAEEAAKHYTSIFPNSKVTNTTRYLTEDRDQHGREQGSVMTVAFELDGQLFTALNGGPQFKFSPATSFQIDCEDQKEVDFFWERLGEGGDESKQQCGWLQDKFGISWQIVPSAMLEMVLDEDKKKVGRYVPGDLWNIDTMGADSYLSMTNALMSMKKIDIAALREAFDKGS